MYSWITYRDEEGWRLIVEELIMAEVGGKWEGIDEAKKLILVLGVLQLKKYLLALIIRNEYQDPPQIQLRWQRQALDYLM